jgi:Asp/Glu/hydantoin racemase
MVARRTRMPVYHIDPNPYRISYGTTIGILLLNSRVPCVPGDVGNASTFKFPVAYRVVDELLVDRLIVDADPALAEPIVREARALEQAGVAAITAGCGYMALFQREVAAALNVPVFLSSWMQVPFMYQTLQPGKKIGAVVADSRYVRKETLVNAGIDESIPLVIRGMEGQAAFCSAIMQEEGTLDSDAVEREVVAVARDLVETNPDVEALLLECSSLPPYGAAVQEALHLPVFDFITMINYVYSALARGPYQGTMY